MRILHVEKFYPVQAGVGSYVRSLAKLQRAGGHQVLQFGCVGDDGPADMPRYRQFASSRRAADLWPMIHNQDAAGKLERFMRAHPVDVAHLHNVYHHLTPSILPVLARHGAGIVMTLHDYRLVCPTKYFFIEQLTGSGRCMRCLPNRVFHAAGRRCAGLGGVGLAIESFVQRFWRRYFRWIDKFICPTPFMRRVMLAAGLPRSKAVVVPNPVETVALPSGATQSPDELLSVGRLSPEKAPQLLLDVAARRPDVRVAIVGDGPLEAHLRRQIAQRSLANVTMTGRVDHDRLGEHYARAAAVVLTSRWMENSPQTMLEAMLAGRVVIAPDQPPLRGWVRDGVTGRLYEPGNADALATAVDEVLADEVGRRKMAAAATELVVREHSPGPIAGRIEELYREAMGRCALR